MLIFAVNSLAVKFWLLTVPMPPPPVYSVTRSPCFSRYWWWELGVKRMDVMVVNIIAYTTIVPDDKARLLMYGFLAGLVLAAHTFVKPSPATQAILRLLKAGETVCQTLVVFPTSYSLSDSVPDTFLYHKQRLRHLFPAFRETGYGAR